MLHRHPDAIALSVIGFVLLVASVPRMLFFSPVPEWTVRPLKIEIPHQEMRAERDRIREDIRREIRAGRDEVKSAIDEVKSAIRH
jgi:hypothetical protein